MVLTGPLDIPIGETASFPECNETCSYSFDYGTSTTAMEHTDNYYKFTYEQSSSTKITYNNTHLQVQEIRLYTPSLTQYDGQSHPFELLIHHIDTQGKGLNVLVSVPIKVQDSAPRSNALSFFESILPHIPQEENDPVGMNTTFSLNDFVPYEPYAFAKITPPYSPSSNSEYITLFFLPTHTVPVLSTAVANQLMQPLHTTSIPAPTRTIPPTDAIYYNKVGANHPDQHTNDDDIWIDCQPTGDALISEDDLAREQGLSPPDTSFWERVKTFEKEHETIFYVLLSFFALFVMLGLFFLGKKVFVKLKDRQQASAVPSPAPPAT